jgi:DNA-binding IclR family transcriptional regulator
MPISSRNDDRCDMDGSDQKTVAAVERALSVLDAFRAEDRSLSLAELAERTKLYKSTILRLIQTLRAAGYLEQREDGTYRVGPSALRLARCYQNATTPADIVLPILRRLVDATSESAGFQVKAGAHRMCLYRVDSPQRLRDHMSPGDLLPLQLGAAGRVIVAFSDHKASHHLLSKNLFVKTSGETAKGMAGVACPIFNEDGFIGALTLSGPDIRFDKPAIARFRRILLEAARDATSQLRGDISIYNAQLSSAAPD